MPKTLVLGIGNLLLGDDGVGVHAIQRLVETQSISADVQVVDGGTCGLDLLTFLEGVDRLIIVDAAKTGHAPGTIVRMAGDQVPAYLSLKTSPHEIGLPELLFAAKLTDIYPPEVVVIGIEPATLETGVELSPPVAARLEDLVRAVAREIPSNE